jgi:glycerol uptake facilitator-like aquaporin
VIFPLSKRLAAEALGTALLVATVVGSGIMGEKLAGGNVALALLGNTLPTGAILVVLILALGPISGAHFNPAVSLIMGLRKEHPWREFLPYATAQIVGGCMGTLIAHSMFELPLIEFAIKARTGPAQWFAEFVATFGLMITILALSRFRAEAIPVAVGPVHHGGLLVHGVHFLRESRRHSRARVDEYLFRHRAGRCSHVHRRAASGRFGGSWGHELVFQLAARVVA